MAHCYPSHKRDRRLYPPVVSTPLSPETRRWRFNFQARHHCSMGQCNVVSNMMRGHFVGGMKRSRYDSHDNIHPLQRHLFAMMDLSKTPARLTWTSLVLFLVTAVNALQCPNLTFLQRHAATRGGACPVPGLLGIFPDLNSSSNTQSVRPPWSSPPKCMTLSASTSSASEKMYCLFTSQEFRNGQGLSLVVSPNTAANLLGMGVLDDAPAPWKWTGSSRVGTTVNKPYRITVVKGKGLGVVATRAIRQGEIIMVDVPALLVSEEFLRETGREGKGHLRRRMVKRGLEQLPESMRRKVMVLQRGPGEYEVDAILGVNLKGLGDLGNSALGLLEEQGTEDGEEMMGLFTEVAVRLPRGRLPNERDAD